MKQDDLIMNMQRSKYVTPRIVTFFVGLEESISNSSAIITSPSDNATPQITDWVEEKDEQFWEF